MIRINGERHWLYAVDDTQTDHVLNVRLFAARTTTPTDCLLCELCEKHNVDDARFLGDGTPWLQKAFERFGHPSNT